jgi:(R,R)-butanediol dehydrogenase/meso-butanediol dehydrogenase/diacetyl reductase
MRRRGSCLATIVAVRALRYHGSGDLRLEHVPVPDVGDGELLIRVEVTGVCGTDAAEYASGPHLYWIRDEPHPGSGHRGPVTPGHELVGIVERVGPRVTGFRPGQRVVSGAGVWCDACAACQAGRTNHCDRYWTVGLQRDGGLAEYAAIPARTCLDVEPYGLTPDAAALAQPMAIAAHALDRGAPEPGQDVLVVGTGGIGAFLVWAATQAGCRVIASDRDPDRRALASRLGAAAVFEPGESMPIIDAVDLVVEVSGTAGGLAGALSVVRPGGRVVLVGLHEPPSEVDLRSVSLREITLVGTVAHRCERDLPAALRLLAARLDGWADVAPVVLPLEAVVEDGLLPMISRGPTRVKTLIDPRATERRPTR